MFWKFKSCNWICVPLKGYCRWTARVCLQRWRRERTQLLVRYTLSVLLLYYWVYWVILLYYWVYYSTLLTTGMPDTIPSYTPLHWLNLATPYTECIILLCPTVALSVTLATMWSHFHKLPPVETLATSWRHLSPCFFLNIISLSFKFWSNFS